MVPLAGQRGASQTNRHDLVRRQFDAKVVRVADGDTMDAIVSGESRPIRIRLEGVDAPEQGEVFSREAVALLRTLTFDQIVRVTGRELDRYGRLVARVSARGRDASAALVGAGLACHAYAYDAALARAESQARASSVGFWAGNARKPGCVERTAFSARGRVMGRGDATAVASFRGNVNSRLYHAPTCPNYNCRNCTAIFTTESAAKAAGFRPANDCLKR
jgi:endonuclease YncB( thermonuclease family)